MSMSKDKNMSRVTLTFSMYRIIQNVIERMKAIIDHPVQNTNGLDSLFRTSDRNEATTRNQAKQKEDLGRRGGGGIRENLSECVCVSIAVSPYHQD